MLISVFSWALVPFLIIAVYPQLGLDQTTSFQLQFAANGAIAEVMLLMPVLLYCMRFIYFVNLLDITRDHSPSSQFHCSQKIFISLTNY